MIIAQEQGDLKIKTAQWIYPLHMQKVFLNFKENLQMDLSLIRQLCSSHKLRWTKHIFLRLAQRGISMEDVQTAILNGELIEDYPNDYPFPSCLIAGYRTPSDMIHIVCAPNSDKTELWLITAYKPNETKWMDDFKTRRVE